MEIFCFHCGEIVPDGVNIQVTVNEKVKPMCCIGCEAVAQTIVDNNLSQYYQFRSEPAHKAPVLIPEELKRKHHQQTQLLDDDSLQGEFTFSTAEYQQTIISIDGISCAACAWLIEMQLATFNGVIGINVNATTRRATIKWQKDRVKLSDIIKKIEILGYQAFPFKANNVEQQNKKQNKTFIKRLGISGILMMQVMMIAAGLYYGEYSGMAKHTEIYLRWANLFLCFPIVSYGAFPFYTGAYRALRVKRLSMDLPVTIAIFLAYSASVWATITQQGEVYFESVAMFTFLLLIGKYLEFSARSRAADVSANLLKLMPMTATKIFNNEEIFIAAKNLLINDTVLIKPGELVPADGIIIEGKSQLNEAMLSGESLPVTKTIDDKVFAGTINGDSNLSIQVNQSRSHSLLSQLIRLSESSQAYKPKIALLSDKIAQYFVACILITSILTFYYWLQYQPEQAFWITLSVLVVTCPCALSLATPTALTCATTRLNKAGIMIKSAHVLETFPLVNHVAFDKTGTLTTGNFVISKIQLVDEDLQDKNLILAQSAALESHSEHALAKAFKPYREHHIQATKIVVHPGQGVSGQIDQDTFKIGKPAWLLENKNTGTSDFEKYKNVQCVFLKNEVLIAAFTLEDKTREDAKGLITTLNQNNISTLILSGDNSHGCNKVGRDLSIVQVHSGLSAQDKVNIIKSISAEPPQHINRNTSSNKNLVPVVAMIGDGVNDTPVFGASHVSIAMGNATDITKNGADVILLNNKLSSVITLMSVSKKNKRIIWQNYAWAFGYNAVVLPLAVAGFITPYMAVIGMSVSSLIVITNSLRLLR